MSDFGGGWELGKRARRAVRYALADAAAVFVVGIIVLVAWFR